VDGGAHAGQFIKGTMLNGTLPFVMNQQGTLLGLLWLVAAYIDEGFNDVVEGIYVIVVHNQVAYINGFLQQQNVLVVIDLRFGIHGAKIRKNGQKSVLQSAIQSTITLWRAESFRRKGRKKRAGSGFFSRTGQGLPAAAEVDKPGLSPWQKLWPARTFAPRPQYQCSYGHRWPGVAFFAGCAGPRQHFLFR
jgi:hypothetical protein